MIHLSLICLLFASAQTTTLVSVDSAGAQGDYMSEYPVISADGRYVAFHSGVRNLVSGDTNGAYDIFVHGRQSGLTIRVSVSSAGAQGNSSSSAPAISGDGRYVAFQSLATNLAPGDTDGAIDVFCHDIQTGQTTLVSVDSAGIKGNALSYSPSISADGRYVAFVSEANNLVPGDTNDIHDIFVHDRQTGQTTRVSVDSAGAQGNDGSYESAISADGRFVALNSAANNLVPGDNNGHTDTFVHDRQSGQTTIVSISSSGMQGNQGSPYWEKPAISTDGQFVAFDSLASNLVTGDTNQAYDVFVHDRQTGQTTRASKSSTGQTGNRSSYRPTISGDGRVVAFVTQASNLILGDTNGAWDILVHDRYSLQTTRVSVDSLGMQGNDDSNGPSISADGRFVAFSSEASNLVPADLGGRDDVFVHDKGIVGLGLTKTGACPGPLDVTIKDATPGGTVMILSGPAGVFVKPNWPCPGLSLQLNPPAIHSLRTADLAGVLHFVANAPPFACGLSVQAVDLTTCRTSNPVVL